MGEVTDSWEIVAGDLVEPMEEVEILLPWGSHLSQAMQDAIEAMESLVKAKKDSLHGEKV